MCKHLPQIRSNVCFERKDLGRGDGVINFLTDGFIQGNFCTEIKLYLRQHPVGDAVAETNFQLWPDRPKESRIPGIAFVKKDRVPEDQQHIPAMAPDIAIEILSPSDNFFDILDKVDEYLQQGTKVVWLVISRTREVMVCTKEKKFYVSDILTAPDLLPGFELPVSRLFEGVSLPEKASS